MRQIISGVAQVGSGRIQLNSYRPGLSARDWGIAQRARLESPGPAAHRPPAPTAVTPAHSLAPQLLRLPLYVTRDPDSRRDWPEVERLLKFLNSIFASAHIVLELTEPGECKRGDASADACPYSHVLDHQYDWLHLALVPDLREDLPFHPSCGRCCLVSDRCDDRSLAQAVAVLLGLAQVADVHIREQLMSAGTGTVLTPSQQQWLRWHGLALLGEPAALPILTIPLWIYLVEEPEALATHRSQAEIRQILERVNRVWAQAGIEFELYNWCHIQDQDLSAQQWGQILPSRLDLLEPLLQYGPRAVHVFFLQCQSECLQLPGSFLCLVGDILQNHRTHTVAASLGKLLGLQEVGGPDQLMGRGSEGFRLSPSEISRARIWATGRLFSRGENSPKTPSLLGLQEQVAVTSEPPTLVEVPIQLWLVRTASVAAECSRDQMLDWLDNVNAIWGQAGIRWVARDVLDCSPAEQELSRAFPNAPDYQGERKPNCLALTQVSGYDPRLLNVFIVRSLPVDGRKLETPFCSWKASQVLLVSERYNPYSREKILASGLAVHLGLKRVTKGPFYRLLSTHSNGVRLSDSEIQEARVAVTPSSLVILEHDRSLSPLSVNLSLGLVDSPTNQYPRARKEVMEILEQVNQIWGQAGIRFRVTGCQSVPIARQDLEAAYPTETKVDPQRKVCGEYLPVCPGQLHLLLIQKLPYHAGTLVSGSQVFRNRHVLLAPDQHHRTSPAVIVARAFASFLNLKLSQGEADSLTNYYGDGTRLTRAEILLARRQVARLNEAMDLQPFGATLEPITLPLRVHAIRNPKYAAQLSVPDVRRCLQELSSVLAVAGIHPEVRWCQELQVSSAVIEEALPNESSDLKRVKSFKPLIDAAPGYESGALNVFILNQVTSVLGNSKFSYAQDAESRVILVSEQDGDLSFLKILGRAVAAALGLASNEFSAKDSLRGGGSGLQLSGREIERLRLGLVEAFPLQQPARAMVAVAEVPSAPAPVPATLSLPFTPPQPGLDLPLRICQVRGACTLSTQQLTEEVAADVVWRLLNIHPRVVDTAEVDVPLNCLEEAYPNSPGVWLARIPMNFGLLRVLGSHPRALTCVLLDHIPPVGGKESGRFSAFPTTRLVLCAARPAGTFSLALLHFLGLPPVEEGLSPELADQARATLKSLFPPQPLK
ncbi:MAG: hypothetical protein U0931_35670 [Vulcanimicrobiota bacterium]